MGIGVYLRDIESSDMLKEDVKADKIYALICDFEAGKLENNYSLHYDNGSLKGFKSCLTICDGDKVMFFNRPFVHRKIERFIKKKKEPKTNMILLEQPLDIKGLGRLVESCEGSFRNVRTRIFLQDLPRKNNFSKDKVRYRTPDYAFYGNYSISYLNQKYSHSNKK
jgi:hypothetical protein